MFLLQAGLIPSWTTGNVSTFSSWLSSVHPPIVSLATLTCRHAHAHTCLLSEPCWNTCCYGNRPGYTGLQVRAYAHVSFNRGIHLPSPGLGHILIFSWLNCYLLSWWGSQAKWGTSASQAPASHSLMFPATCLFNSNNYIDHNSNQDVLSPYHELRQYSKHLS